MKRIASAPLTLVLAALAIVPALAFASQVARADDGATVTPVFKATLPNVPGRNIIAVTVDYPPGGKSKPHHHAPSAFIFAYVVSGAIRSQVEGEPVKVYKAGESWRELPGAHHVVSENASATEPARLLAVFVVGDGEPLTTFDP